MDRRRAHGRGILLSLPVLLRDLNHVGLGSSVKLFAGVYNLVSIFPNLK